jgi:hypothetical protein
VGSFDARVARLDEELSHPRHLNVRALFIGNRIQPSDPRSFSKEPRNGFTMA